MRCKPGIQAIILKAVKRENVGRVVTVRSYIGHYQQNETFDYNGITCRVPISDHYWFVDCPGGLETAIGPTTRAYCPDTWLLPITPPPPVDVKTQHKELTTT